jgi:hypothetical protein
MSSSDDSWDAPARTKRKPSLHSRQSTRSKTSTAKSNSFDEGEEDYLEENLLQPTKQLNIGRPWNLPEPAKAPEPSPSIGNYSSRYTPQPAEPEPTPPPNYTYYQQTPATTVNPPTTGSLNLRMVIGIDFGTTFTGLGH